MPTKSKGAPRLLAKDPAVVFFPKGALDRMLAAVPQGPRPAKLSGMALRLVDVDGGALGIFGCVQESKSRSCLPRIARTGPGQIAVIGCVCRANPPEPPAPRPSSCRLVVQSTGKLSCQGTCPSGRCRTLRYTSGGQTFLACLCSSGAF
jgi:hypothetical protein